MNPLLAELYGKLIYSVHPAIFLIVIWAIYILVLLEARKMIIKKRKNSYDKFIIILGSTFTLLSLIPLIVITLYILQSS